METTGVSVSQGHAESSQSLGIIVKLLPVHEYILIYECPNPFKFP